MDGSSLRFFLSLRSVYYIHINVRVVRNAAQGEAASQAVMESTGYALLEITAKAMAAKKDADTTTNAPKERYKQ